MQGKNSIGVAGFHKEDGSSQQQQHPGAESVLEKNMLGYAATGIVVVPTMLIAATVPNSFCIATDIAVSAHQNTPGIVVKRGIPLCIDH